MDENIEFLKFFEKVCMGEKIIDFNEIKEPFKETSRLLE